MSDAGVPSPLEPLRRIYSVSQLSREVRTLLEASYPDVWVQGEISNYAAPPSGHLYFSLKDESAVLRCALFRNRRDQLLCRPENGMQVLAHGRLSFYEGRGDCQLIVSHLEEAGEGALRRAFEVLKRKLDREGLFDPAHKKSLPAFPRRVGVISSPTGAALRDILSTLRRRFPALPVLLYPVSVQGAGAAEAICAALRLADRRRDCDVLLLARGGGSLEDLQAFNEESVARAIHACALPVVSGVGHEIDVTIADFVADRRAPTPTAAAELVSPDGAELQVLVRRQRQRLERLSTDQLNRRGQRVDQLRRRLVHPRQRLAELGHRVRGLGRTQRLLMATQLQQRRLRAARLQARLLARSPQGSLERLRHRRARAAERLHRAAVQGVRDGRGRLVSLHGRLAGISPRATLARGYAIVRTHPEGRLLRDARDTGQGARVSAELARGRLTCVVESVDEERPE